MDSRVKQTINFLEKHVETSHINTLARCKPLLGTFVELSLSADLHAEKCELINNEKSENTTLKQSINKPQSLAQWSVVLFDEIERIHYLLGFHELSSELSQLNLAMLKGPITDFAISSDLAYVLEVAQGLYLDSDGMFDVTVAPYLVKSGLLPDHLNLDSIDKSHFGCFSNVSLSDHKITTTKALCIDLGGIAKGYAVDCAFLKLPPHINCTINAGGDMRSNHWQQQTISIKYGQKAKALKQVVMKNQSVATSGSYYHEGYSAIIEPKLKQDKRIKGSVSVFASQAIIADALTKIMALCSPKKISPILQKYEATGVVISRFGFIKNI